MTTTPATSTVSPAPTDTQGDSPKPPERGRLQKLDVQERLTQVLRENKRLRHEVQDKERQIDELQGQLDRLRSETADEKTAAQAAKRQMDERFEAGLALVRQNIPDFDETMSRLRPLPADVLDLIKVEDSGPLLLYFIGKNPVLHSELSSLTIDLAARRIRRLVVELEQEAERRGRKLQIGEAYSQIMTAYKTAGRVG